MKALENPEVVEIEKNEKVAEEAGVAKSAEVSSVSTPEKNEKTEKTNLQSFTADFSLILHTAYSQAIFTGAWAENKIGLLQFEKSLQILWTDFEQDDPYAEWQLFKIHDAIQNLKKSMREQEHLLRTQIRNLRGIQIKPFRNTSPFAASLSSTHILVVVTASLIAEIDFIIRQALVLKQMGIIVQGQSRTDSFREQIQKIFEMAEKWQTTGITRQDLLDNTKTAKEIKKKLGDIPEEILHQKVILPFLCINE
jgi:integrating conjugative element protein (TIGR03761 family)